MRNSCIPPILSMGKIAIAVTIIPTPPIHCKMARHNKIPLLTSSSPVITVDPVVVIPDTASKRASVKLSPTSAINNGKAANAAKDIHDKVVNKNAPRARSLAFGE